MKVGIISDIHGNAVALRRVLEHARREEVERLLVLGDLIGYYYDAVGVLDLLAAWPRDTVRGNHEDMLFQIIDGVLDPKVVLDRYGSGLNIALAKLSRDQISALRELPEVCDIEIDSVSIRLCHGAPWSTTDYLYPDAVPDIVDQYDSEKVDFLFFGHTHYPVVFRGPNTMIINPGSVGQSRVHGGIADWGILNTVNSSYRQMHTRFDAEGLLTEVKVTDPHLPYLRSVLERNDINQK